MNRSLRLAAVALLLVAILGAVYLPGAGQGFKSDDFRWVAESRVRQLSDWPALFGTNTGFYRPLVALSFAIDERLFGWAPLGYGLTNFALLLACLAAIAALARALGLPPGAALAAGIVWAFNFQGIAMAVLWLSGRTALLLTLFAVLAARAVVRRRMGAAAAWTFLALLSKEEAVVLPVLLLTWIVLLGRRDSAKGRLGVVAALRESWPLALPLVAYAVMRGSSGAFGPMTAPAYYRFTMAPRVVANNIARYFDFAVTTWAAVVASSMLLAWRLPRPKRSEVGVIRLGAVWLVAGYAITTFLPIRSPLYACFPSVGVALAGAALLGSVWSRTTPAGRTRLVAGACVLPMLLVPVYWARNQRYVKPAALSAQLVSGLRAAAPGIAEGSTVVLLDDVTASPNIAGAFGTLYDIAVSEAIGRPTRVWVEPPPGNWVPAGLHRPDGTAGVVVFALRGGRLERAAPGAWAGPK